MKRFLKSFSILSLCFYIGTSLVQAGNPDRIGQAGAAQLLINPWPVSNGTAGSNIAGVKGVESISLNPAGITQVHATDFTFSNTTWLGSAAGVKINSFGAVQKIGDDDAIGATFISYSFGDIPATTYNNSDMGTGATFNISYINIGISYAHRFSNAISTGVTFKILNEGVASANATGLCLDAGIQYHTGTNDRVKFGIALRNVGSAYGYSGSALSFKALPNGGQNTMTVNSRVQDFELPSALQLGGSYDFFLDTTKTENILTAIGSFTSNSFDKDQGRFALQYGWKRIIYLRAGYILESDIWNKELSSKAYNGPCAGITVQVPFGKDKKQVFGIDYSYQSSPIFGGTHCFGARLNL
jgi:hypothetical protein